MNVKLNKIAIQWILGIVLTIVLFIIYLGIAIRNGFNVHSDAASIILETSDILEGNLFLSNWNLSTVTFYTTDIPFYTLFSIIFSPSSELLFIVPAFIYSLIVVLTLLITYKFSSNHKLLKLLLVFMLLGFPNINIAQMLLSGPIHMGTILLLLISYYLVGSIKGNSNGKIYFLFFVTLSFSIIGDDFGLYFGALPIILVSLIRLIKDRASIVDKKLLYISFCSVLFGKLSIFLIENLGGFNLPGTGQVNFVELTSIFSNILIAIEQLLYIYDANIFGQPIFSLSTIFKAFRLLVFIILVLSLILTVKKFLFVSRLQQILLVSTLLNLIAYTFSSYMTGNLGLTRYLLPFFVFSSMIIVNIVDLKFNKSQLFKPLLICVSLVYIFLSLSPISYSIAQNRFDRLSDFLIDKNLEYGFGEFWSSNIVTLESDYKVKVRSVIPSENQIVPMNWLSKQEWYTQKANFLVFDNGNIETTNIFTKTAKKTFGNPIETYEYEGFTILVWDKDISLLLGKANS